MPFPHDGVDPDSVQLQPGQKFHHIGGPGIPYFRMEVIEDPKNGDIYPTMTTPPAAVALPVKRNKSGMITSVFLLKQSGRGEVKDGDAVIKAVGSYCNPEERPVDAAIRSLRDKLHIDAMLPNLTHYGKTPGFGPQYQFPVEMYLVEDFELNGEPLPPEYECVEVNINDVARLMVTQSVFDDATHQILGVVLARNHLLQAESH